MRRIISRMRRREIISHVQPLIILEVAWVARLYATSFFSSSIANGFALHCPSSRPQPFRLRHFKTTFCSNFPWVGLIPSMDRRISRHRNWRPSIRRCFRCMEIPAERRSRYSGVRSIRTAVEQRAARRAEMVAPTGRAFRTPALTTSKCRQFASTTTLMSKTRLGFVSRRTTGYRLPTPIPSTLCSTQSLLSPSIHSRRDTRMSSPKTS